MALSFVHGQTPLIHGVPYPQLLLLLSLHLAQGQGLCNRLHEALIPLRNKLVLLCADTKTISSHVLLLFILWKITQELGHVKGLVQSVCQNCWLPRTKIPVRISSCRGPVRATPKGTEFGKGKTCEGVLNCISNYSVAWKLRGYFNFTRGNHFPCSFGWSSATSFLSGKFLWSKPLTCEKLEPEESTFSENLRRKCTLEFQTRTALLSFPRPMEMI